MPTVTITDSTGGDFTGVDDAPIDASNATTNYGSASPMGISGTELRSLIRFSGLSNIPSSATITDVTLRLNATEAFDPGTLALHRLLRNWVEAQATATIYSTGNNWELVHADGDLDRAASASASIAYSSGTGWKEFSDAGLVTDVQNWVDGTNANDGWLLRCTTSVYLIVHSSEGTNGSRPELVVTYTAGGGGDTLVVVGNPQRNRRTSGRRM